MAVTHLTGRRPRSSRSSQPGDVGVHLGLKERWRASVVSVERRAQQELDHCREPGHQHQRRPDSDSYAGRSDILR